jgi:hypothetical protein
MFALTFLERQQAFRRPNATILVSSSSRVASAFWWIVGKAPNVNCCVPAPAFGGWIGCY